MKAHVGVDNKEQLIHAAAATPAHSLPRATTRGTRQLDAGRFSARRRTKVWGDSAYQNQKEAMHKAAPNAQDMTNRRGSNGHPLSDADRARNQTKSKVRAKVERVFHIMKRIFGFTMTRYRGIDKNDNRLFVTCGLINIYMKRQFCCNDARLEAQGVFKWQKMT
jgi:transposase, IS5 family